MENTTLIVIVIVLAVGLFVHMAMASSQTKDHRLAQEALNERLMKAEKEAARLKQHFTRLDRRNQLVYRHLRQQGMEDPSLQLEELNEILERKELGEDITFALQMHHQQYAVKKEEKNPPVISDGEQKLLTKLHQAKRAVEDWRRQFPFEMIDDLDK